jgi:hypothetical protein
MDERVMKLFRFVSGNLGIYEAVDVDCPRSDERRQKKPDGSWLPKVGASFPGAISFWTEHGLRTYIQSGLCDWHRSIVTKPVKIIIASAPKRVHYQDAFQVICKPIEVDFEGRMDWVTFSQEMRKLLK